MAQRRRPWPAPMNRSPSIDVLIHLKRAGYALWSRRVAWTRAVFQNSRNLFRLGPARHACALVTFVALCSLAHLRGSDFVFSESLFAPLLFMHDAVVTLRNAADPAHKRSRREEAASEAERGETDSASERPVWQRIMQCQSVRVDGGDNGDDDTDEDEDDDDNKVEDYGDGTTNDRRRGDGGGDDDEAQLSKPGHARAASGQRVHTHSHEHLTRRHFLYVCLLLIFASSEMWLLVLRLPVPTMVAACAWCLMGAADAWDSAREFWEDLDTYARLVAATPGVEGQSSGVPQAYGATTVADGGSGAGGVVRVVRVLKTLWGVLYRRRRAAAD